MTFPTPIGSVIFVDDDPVVRCATVQSLELADIDVRPFESAREALTNIERPFNGVVVSDIRMPDIDGLEFFKAVHQIDPAIPFILITGHGDVPMAVNALRDGADDFIPKPFASGHLIASIQRGLERRRLELDNRALRTMVDESSRIDSVLLGETPAMVSLREAIEQVARADVQVLIEGETGVGKELVALMLHRNSRRRGQPFINIACGALPHETAARHLFGSVGATPPGQIVQANRGTLLLDEIDRLDPVLQQNMLRVIEDHEVVEVGGRHPVTVDIRVIATARDDLSAAVNAGRFREDLYYAINVIRLRIPPLRERRADIPLLFAHFVDSAATQLRRKPVPMTDAVRCHLIEHDWPGNVRELKSFAFKSAVGFEGLAVQARDDNAPNLPERVGRFEASVIRSVLAECGGNAAEALVRLGIPRKTFYDKLHRHGIDIASFR